MIIHVLKVEFIEVGVSGNNWNRASNMSCRANNVLKIPDREFPIVQKEAYSTVAPKLPLIRKIRWISFNKGTIPCKTDLVFITGPILWLDFISKRFWAVIRVATFGTTIFLAMKISSMWDKEARPVHARNIQKRKERRDHKESQKEQRDEKSKSQLGKNKWGGSWLLRINW